MTISAVLEWTTPNTYAALAVSDGGYAADLLINLLSEFDCLRRSTTDMKRRERPAREGKGSCHANSERASRGDVSADPRYLTAFGSTRSEIIVPVLDAEANNVVGTIDVESEEQNAFSKDVQDLLESCSAVIRPLWPARISS